MEGGGMVSWARKGKEEEGGEVCTGSKAEDGGWVSESEEGGHLFSAGETPQLADMDLRD